MAKKKQELTVEEKLAAALVREDEQPYEVPGNWVWTRLNILYNFIDYRGKTPHKISSGVPLITAKNVKQGYIDYSIAEFISHEEYLTRQTRGISHKGDILFTTEAPLGNVAIADLDEFSAGQRLITLQKYPHSAAINNKFYAFYMLSGTFKKDIDDRKTGTTVAGIKAEKLKLVPVPLPPLAEQQRIVDRIESLFDQLDQAKALIQEALDSFETRKAAILHQAFTGALTKKWREENILDLPECRYNSIVQNRNTIGPISKEVAQYIEDLDMNEVIDKNNWLLLKAMVLCENITCGGTPTGFISEKGDIPFLKVYNIVNNQIDFNYKPQFIDNNTNLGKLKSSILKPRDIVMNIVGPPLRKIAFIPEDYPEWNMNQAIVRFRTIDYLEPKYFYYCLLYPNTLDSVIRNTKGVVGQANISITQSRNLIIPVPSWQEQQEIVRILDGLFEKEQNAKDLCDQIDQIDTIKKTILGKAFRGELGTNVAGEESAVVLLKEILYKN